MSALRQPDYLTFSGEFGTAPHRIFFSHLSLLVRRHPDKSPISGTCTRTAYTRGQAD